MNCPTVGCFSNERSIKTLKSITALSAEEVWLEEGELDRIIETQYRKRARRGISGIGRMNRLTMASNLGNHHKKRDLLGNFELNYRSGVAHGVPKPMNAWNDNDRFKKSKRMMKKWLYGKHSGWIRFGISGPNRRGL